MKEQLHNSVSQNDFDFVIDDNEAEQLNFNSHRYSEYKSMTGMQNANAVQNRLSSPRGQTFEPGRDENIRTRSLRSFEQMGYIKNKLADSRKPPLVRILFGPKNEIKEG